MTTFDEQTKAYINNPFMFQSLQRSLLQEEPTEEKPKREPERNQSVRVLMDWFVNVKGKRIEAAKQLRQRFLCLDYEDQIKVMDLFIEGSKGYRKWCYETLTKWREPRYDDRLISLWQEHKENQCAWTLVSQLPAEKLLTVADSIVHCLYKDYLDDPMSHPKIPIGLYYTMCKKLIGYDGFRINQDLLRYHCLPDLYLVLLKRAGIKEDEDTCFAIIHKCILNEFTNHKENITSEDANGNRLYTVCYDRTARVLCEILLMGHEELVRNFLQWDAYNMFSFLKAINGNSYYTKQESGLAYFADFTLDNLPCSLNSLKVFVKHKLRTC